MGPQSDATIDGDERDLPTIGSGFAAVLGDDPRNRWLARASRLRLEAEMVRDQALALAGLISLKLGGPSVFPPQPDGLWRAAFNGERDYPTSTGEDRYRRGLYVFLRRTVPNPTLSIFDAPSRESCSFRRLPTNTPLQAFVTLNDPVYVEAAQGLARRMLRESGRGRVRGCVTGCGCVWAGRRRRRRRRSWRGTSRRNWHITAGKWKPRREAGGGA